MRAFSFFLLSLWFSSLNLLFSSFSWAICSSKQEFFSSNSSHLQILVSLSSPFSLIDWTNLHFRWSGYTLLAWKSWDFGSSHTVSIQVFCSLLFPWYPHAKSLIDFMMTAKTSQNNVKWLKSISERFDFTKKNIKKCFCRKINVFSKQKN